MTDPGRRRNAEIIPIATLTREATMRRLADLRRQGDSVPGPVRDAAEAAIAWRSVDDELARLVYDSAHDLELTGLVRTGAATRRLLTFESPGLTLEVELTSGRLLDLVCQVVPAQSCALLVRHPRFETAALHDADGTFHVRGIPPGPLSLRCEPDADGAHPVSTSWMRI